MQERALKFGIAASAGIALLTLTAGCSSDEQARACVKDGSALVLGFYTQYDPISHRASQDSGSEGYSVHAGYEADLLSALEAMDGTGLSFDRRPIDEWNRIWLLPAGPDYDMVGGGITILDSRTLSDEGETVVRFTAGHVHFRTALLVRTEDAERLAGLGDLTSSVTVGVNRGTTGEETLLAVTGIANEDGVLATGTRVVTESGEVTADGTKDFVITAAASSEVLRDRISLEPPNDDAPQVFFIPEGVSGLDESGQHLLDGLVDAIAGDHIGFEEEAANSDGSLTVAELGSEFDSGGFVLAADQDELISCIDDKIDYLTDRGRIGFSRWYEDRDVFIRRAQAW